MKTKPKILILVNYYLPGYKAGGSLRTITNMVDHLSDNFEFLIITRDRDLGDKRPYPDVIMNEWTRVGSAWVFYTSPEQQTLMGIKNIINTTSYDILYLNGFFDPLFTLKPLLLRRMGQLRNTPVVLAPRGEFSDGALRLKSLKKKVYIWSVSLLGLYNNLCWQASSEYESEDIQNEFAVSGENIHVALDLSVKAVAENIWHKSRGTKTKELRIVFLSRISPMKNLDYALRILKKVTTHLTFDIYGPIEDESYWIMCQSLAEMTPKNVKINYCGSVAAKQVSSIFSQYDLFFFPTRGENYGHVIAESLSVGTPVLLSNKTPWKNLEKDGLGWDVELENVDVFKRILESYALNTMEEKNDIRNHIRKKVLERLTNMEVLEANRQLFYKCINQKKGY